MLTTAHLFECKYCDYKSSRAYNLRRHYELKHAESDSEDFPQNRGELTQNRGESPQNRGESPQNQGESPQNEGECFKNMCHDCGKTFARIDCLKRHAIVCKGTPKQLTCTFCQNLFECESVKNRHMITCKLRNCALIVKPAGEIAIPTTTPAPATTNNSQAANVNATNCENVQQIGNQQNIVNIVVYDPNNIEFLTDHINLKSLFSDMASKDKPAMISHYSRALINRKENQCVRKTNLRSSHSQVHIGDNNWESRLDKDVYPKVVCNIANQMSDLVNSMQHEKAFKLHSKVFSKLLPFLDYMSDEGYAYDVDKEVEMKRHFRKLGQELVLIFSDCTKTNMAK